ncbi:ferritin-like domain-containing protein [Microlunatus sp. Gsoil 973]|uniref:ferritin-like domain-containing protein n=1 Tax=Microlunatus sp. Gsoil 973 TaxID=2672569 RepID=UPI0012B4796F|nr:ferritin-like domain-containing protein [Microlunatus sp. Gsoil 973]QGN33224.1 ferritin-like domain-containing protein [Microlunatus sp. Gsoil 973]
MSENRFLDEAIGRSAETPEDHAKLAGMVAEATTGSPADPSTDGPSDGSILNFALNLEYLEAEFYLRGATGQGLPDDMIGGTGKPGEVSGGRQVDFRSPLIKNIAREIAMDERQHVAFLRSALGNAAAARPRISLDHSFTAAATAAGLIQPGDTFDVYANDRNFLFAAFLFEDVGVTAFKGAAPFITNKTYLDAAAGLLATEAYHAGIVRATLFSESLIDDTVFDVISKISAVRNAVSGPADDDQDLGSRDEANLVPTDEYGRVFGRSAEAVLNIVYLDADAPSAGGFYPDGLNGDLAQGAARTAR